MKKLINFLKDKIDDFCWCLILILLFMLACQQNYRSGYSDGFYTCQRTTVTQDKRVETTPTPIPTVTPTVTPVPTVSENSVSENEIVDDIPLDYTEEDLRYLSSIIQCEAGNQCKAGQQAVGIVVINRRDHEVYFADTVREVIYQQGQFTPAHNGFLNKALAAYDAGTLSDVAIEAARYALEGNKMVSYNGEKINMESFLYFNGRLSNARIRIQDHDFT